MYGRGRRCVRRGITDQPVQNKTARDEVTGRIGRIQYPPLLFGSAPLVRCLSLRFVTVQLTALDTRNSFSVELELLGACFAVSLKLPRRAAVVVHVSLSYDFLALLSYLSL